MEQFRRLSMTLCYVTCIFSFTFLLLWHAFCHVTNKLIWWWWWCQYYLQGMHVNKMQKLNFTRKTAKSRLVPPFEGLRVTYTVHLWFVGKRVVDFLLVLIEYFAPALTIEALWVDIDRNRCVRKGVVHFERKFQGNGASPTNDGVVMRDSRFSRFGTIPACDRRTDTRWQQASTAGG